MKWVRTLSTSVTVLWYERVAKFDLEVGTGSQRTTKIEDHEVLDNILFILILLPLYMYRVCYSSHTAVFISKRKIT